MKRLAPLQLALLLALLPLLVQAQVVVPRPSARPTPPPAEQPSTVFCVIGDSQTGGKPERLRITATIAHAMAAERPAFVLGTGDYIDGARTVPEARLQIERYFAALLPLQKFGPVPLAAAPGNHDLGGGLGSLFEQNFGKRYHSFDVAGGHFIILDTQQPNQYGRIDGAQWQWLCADLAAARERPLIFVALHQPLFPVGVHRGSSLDKYPKQRDRLHLLLAQSRVSAVFSGHEHLYNHHERDGVHYFINGGGGAPLYARAHAGGFYHYLRVEYNDEGYAVEVKRVEPPGG